MTSGAEQSSASSSSTKEVIQILVLKNKRSFHDNQAYSSMQSIIIRDSFYRLLGDKLKNFPQVTHKTPLITLQFFEQDTEMETKIFGLAGNKTIQLTEMKAKLKGYLHLMIVFKRDDMEEHLIPTHLKLGIDIFNKGSIWKKSIKVENPAEIYYMNIGNLPFKNAEDQECEYTLYYAAFDDNITPLAKTSAIKKIDFKMFNITQNWAGILRGLGILGGLMLVLGLRG